MTVRTKKLRHELCGNVVNGGIISAWKEGNILNSRNSKSLGRKARCLQAGEKTKSVGTKLLEDLQCLWKAFKYVLKTVRELLKDFVQNDDILCLLSRMKTSPSVKVTGKERCMPGGHLLGGYLVNDEVFLHSSVEEGMGWRGENAMV